MRLSNRTRAPLRLATLLLAGVLAACSDAPTGAAPDSQEATLAQQVAALGFRADMIEDHGEFVLVEGDIHLSKAQLRTVLPLGSDDPMRPRFQYHTTNLVSSPKVRYIRVDVSGLALLPDWQTAAREALTHWSGISNSYVRLVESGPADITVSSTCTSGNVAAYASFPSGGNPGSTIYVNACFGFSISHAQRVHNMVHEFGHTLGFRHSNYAQNGESAATEGAVHVPNTPTSGNDGGSVMNGGTALNGWAGFSSADLAAARTLYPVPTVWVTSGSNAEVHWLPLAGATYSVQLVRWAEVRNQYHQVISSTSQIISVGTTTQDFISDAGRAYTGTATCYGGSTSYYFQYDVEAVFPNGSIWASVPAPVANCSQVGDET